MAEVPLSHDAVIGNRVKMSPLNYEQIMLAATSSQVIRTLHAVVVLESRHGSESRCLLHGCCRYFTACLKAAAAKHCGGKLLFFHEGGYSAYYVPFCGLAVVEELAGITTKVVDPELEEHCKVREQWGGDGGGV